MDLNSTVQTSVYSEVASPISKFKRQMSLISNAHTQSDLAEIPENNQGERRGSAAGSEDRESINDYIESTQRMA